MADIPSNDPVPSDLLFSEFERSLPTELQKESKVVQSLTVIGNYHLLRKLGEGGMGIVWLAEQQQPVQRQVALKVIKSARNSDEMLIRFESEHRTLAMMEHPNVAKILDAGTTDQGDPYFVMEWVDGIPVTAYCDLNQLTIDQRLELFIDVCAGIQHAHQKGVIHRDLKPNNILISTVDGKPVPKVIDFGLAKIVRDPNTQAEQSTLTSIGQVLGTLKYMSPEQARLNPVGIDTRTDVYSLGVLLYELLTGQTPLDNDTIRDEPVLSLLEKIQSHDTLKPSSKLSHHNWQKIQQITSNRKTDKSHLTRILTGDLDWVVMKALEKPQDRRYDSAAAFADDIRRYLSGETVIARPPSLNYRIQKFVSRNRIAVVATTLIIISLIAGIVSTSIAMVRAWDAETLANQRFLDSEIARRDANAARASQAAKAVSEKEARLEAQQRLGQLQKTTTILANIFDDLNLSSMDEPTEPIPTRLSKRLIAAGKLLDEQTIGDPTTTAQLQNRLAVTLLSLGHPSDAIPLLESALRLQPIRPDSSDHLPILLATNLAGAYHAADLLAKATQTYESIIEVANDSLGPDHQTTKNITRNLSQLYLQQNKDEIALGLLDLSEAQSSELPDVDLREFDQYIRQSVLATYYEKIGNLSKATSLNEKLLEWINQKLGPSHFQTLTAKLNLSRTYALAGEKNKATTLAQETLDEAIETFGSSSPLTHKLRSVVAETYGQCGDHKTAIDLFEKCIEDFERPTLSIDNLITLQNYSVQLDETGEYELAKSQLLKVLQERKKIFGLDSAEITSTLNCLGTVCYHAKELEESIRFYEAELSIRGQHPALSEVDLARCLKRLGITHRENGQNEQGIPLLEKALAIQSALNLNEKEQADTKQALSMCYYNTGRLKLATPLFEQLSEFSIKHNGKDHQETITAMNNMAFAYTKTGKLDQAILIYEEVVPKVIAHFGINSTDSITSMNNLTMAYFAASAYEKAIPWLKKALNAKQTVLGTDHIETIAAAKLLAFAYSKSGNREVAIELNQDVLKKTNTDSDELATLRKSILEQLSDDLIETDQWGRGIEVNQELLETRTKELGREHPQTITAMFNVAMSLYHAEQFNEALEILEEMDQQLTGESQATGLTSIEFLPHMGHAYWLTQEFEEAAQCYRRLLEHRIETFGPDAQPTLYCMINLAVNVRETGHSEEAIELLKHVITKSNRKTDRDWAKRELITSYFSAKKLDKFKAAVEKDLQLKRRETTDPMELSSQFVFYSSQFLKLNDPIEAEALARECLSIRERLARGTWKVANCRSVLGESLMVQGKRKEAEPHLVEGYWQLKKHQSQIDSSIRTTKLLEAVDRLIRFYKTEENETDLQKFEFERQQLALGNQQQHR